MTVFERRIINSKADGDEGVDTPPRELAAVSSAGQQRGAPCYQNGAGLRPRVQRVPQPLVPGQLQNKPDGDLEQAAG